MQNVPSNRKLAPQLELPFLFPNIAVDAENNTTSRLLNFVLIVVKKETNKNYSNMKCPKCKTENDADAIHCSNCSFLLKKTKANKKHIIFISHAEADQKIVADFCKMLQLIRCPHPFEYKIFCSSEIGCIECGKDSSQEIYDNLNNCNNVFCILTDNSYDRPWVMYEIGYIKGKSSKKNLMPIAIDIDINKIRNYPYSKFNIYKCDEQHLSTLMIELLNNIIPDSCNGKKDILKKSFAPHIKDFLKKLKK
jgi:hypothetical protein